MAKSAYVGLLCLLISGCWAGATVGIMDALDENSKDSLGPTPTPFTLLTPSNGSEVLALTPTFVWDDADFETGYKIQVDNESTFQEPHTFEQLSLPENTTTFTLPGGFLVDGNTYYWRVIATNPAGEEFPITSPPMFTPRDVYWAKSFGTAVDDDPSSLALTADGGAIFAAEKSQGMAFVKLNSDSSIEWERVIDGQEPDSSGDIIQTTDGGYIAGGTTESFGAGNDDFLVIKLDKDGAIQWQNTYGGAMDDSLDALALTSEGGYVVSGTTRSFGAGETDLWVLKLASDGTIEWQKTFGGGSYDYISQVVQGAGGNYFVAASSRSYTPENGPWILKLSSSDGSILWETLYDAAGFQTSADVLATSDGGVIVTANYGAFDQDFWVLKLSATGTLDWTNTYGHLSNWDEPRSIISTLDGGYLVAGRSSSSGAGSYDVLLVKIDATGGLTWKKTFGGTGWDVGEDVVEFPNGDFLVAAQTNSFGAGGDDVWILKIPSAGVLQLPDFGADSIITANPPTYSIVGTSATVTTTTVLPQPSGLVSGLIYSNTTLVP